MVCGARGSLGLFFSVGVCVQGAEEGQLTSFSDLGLRFCGSPWAGQVVRGTWTVCRLCVSSPPRLILSRDFLLSESLFLAKQVLQQLLLLSASFFKKL